MQELNDSSLFFGVRSTESDNVYKVNFVVNGTDMPGSDCEDLRKFHWPCNHFCAVFGLLT
jgi:hypothetical protein